MRTRENPYMCPKCGIRLADAYTRTLPSSEWEETAPIITADGMVVPGRMKTDIVFGVCPVHGKVQRKV